MSRKAQPAQTCANCTAPAVYWVCDAVASEVTYCRVHLPVHLLPRAEAGQLNQPTGPDDK